MNRWSWITTYRRLVAKGSHLTLVRVADRILYSPRARGVLFVLKGPYDARVPPIVKFSQEFESARLTKIILSKSTVKTLYTLVPSKSRTAI